MGFWHTGYEEFHDFVGPEDTGERPPPKPPAFICGQCGLEFASDRELRTHEFVGHATRRPSLVFKGRDCGRARLLISAPSSPSDWCMSDVTEVRINGRTTTSEGAKEYLADARSGVQALTLVNGSLHRTVEFDFSLAADEDLAVVDHALDQLIFGGELSWASVEEFITRASRGGTANRYREGLAMYLYAVLDREDAERNGSGPSDQRSILRFEEKCNRAVHALGDFDRAPAEAICGLVALHYNQFDLALRKTNSPRVSDVAARFSAILSGENDFDRNSLADRAHGTLDSALSDRTTEELMRFYTLPIDGSDLSSIRVGVSRSDDLRPYDQLKVRLLACEALLAGGNVREAQKVAELLQHSNQTDAWNKAFLARIQEVER